MKKLVAGLVAAALAGSLAACGSGTTNEAVANDAVANEMVLNDELPYEDNAVGANDAALLDNGAAAENALTPTDNSL